MARDAPYSSAPEKRIGAAIPEEHYNALVAAARENDRAIAAEIRFAIRDWLKKHGRIAN